MNEGRLLPPAQAPPAPQDKASTTESGSSQTLVRPTPKRAVSQASRTCRLLAFASGKGGVGKSLLVANLGIQLARQGRRVILLDCDVLNSALHSYLGAAAPNCGLDDLLSGRSSSLLSLVRDTSVPRLRLVAGPRSGQRKLPTQEDLENLVLEAYELPADFALIDLPSGRHPLSLDLLPLADCGILVTTPEPGSLEGAFRLVEEVVRQCLATADARLREAAEAALGFSEATRGPAAYLDALAEMDPNLAHGLTACLRSLRLAFVINQVRADAEAQTALNLRSLCRHYLGAEINFVGAVEFDLSAWQATRQRKSLSQKYPNAPATRTIEQIATALTAQHARPPKQEARWERLADRTHYQILEVPPSASQRDLQRAYDRLQAVTGPEVEAIGGAVHRERVRALRARVETAYRTLVFLEPRSKYDRALISAGVLRPEETRDLSLELNEPPPRAPAAAGARSGTGASVRPVAPVRPHSDDTPPAEPPTINPSGAPLAYTGAVLGGLRRERGLTLEAIGAITKVRITHLRCLEEESFSALPAPIFLKGFVREYARCLKLDPEKVWEDYRIRYEKWKKARSEE